MADTSVTYTGTGLQTNFSVPFPFLSRDHVIVEVNLAQVLTPSVWTWVNDSTIAFRNAPADGAAIKIYRQTAGDSRLVDFQNAAVLTEADLDLSANQIFYLVQEAKENFTDLINGEIFRIGGGNGIVSTDPVEILSGLVEQILADATALELSQRVQDIDDNAESIISVQTALQGQINALATATAATVFLQATAPVPGVGGVPDPIPEGARWYDSDDGNRPYIYDNSVWVDLSDPRIAQNQTDITALQARVTTTEGDIAGQATSISALNATVYDAGSGVVANADAITQLQTDVAGNTASITTEANTRSTADTALANLVALLGAENGAQNAFILNSSTVKIDSDVGDTLATRLSALSAADATNAANIISEQTARVNADGAIASELALLGAENGAATAFILNSGTVKIDSDAGETLATRFSNLSAEDASNAAAITSEQTARIAGDNVLASDIALLGAANAGETAFIFDSATVKIDSDAGETFATRLSNLAASDASNAAAIITEQSARIAADSAQASDITSLQSTINNRNRTFAQDSAPAADNVGDIWIDTNDNNKYYRWNGSAWVYLPDGLVTANASAISVLDTRVDGNDTDIAANASSITSLTSRVTTAEGDIASANVTIAANTSAISSNDGDITALNARYGVSLNVNGYVSGFVLNNSGVSSDFVILADKFRVVDPSGDPSEPEYSPFSISGGKINMTGDVVINGSLLVNGSVTNTQINDGTVRDTELAANAATEVYSDEAGSSSATLLSSNVWTEICRVTVPSPGEVDDVIVCASYDGIGFSNDATPVVSARARLQVSRNGGAWTTIWEKSDVKQTSTLANIIGSIQVVDYTHVSGNTMYRLNLKVSSDLGTNISYTYHYYNSLTALVAKR